MAIKVSSRRSVFLELRDYCHLTKTDHEFLEITEWSNGEGFDIFISSGASEKLFSLTHGELEALFIASRWREDT